MKKLNKYIGWVSLIIAIGALGASLFQSRDKDYDNMMFAVAMLSALVTTLIGWNIYALFDIRSFKKNVSEKLSAQRDEYYDWIQKANNGSIRVNTNLMMSMFMAFNKDNEEIKDFIYLDYGIKTIRGHIRLDNLESAQVVINELISKIPSIPPTTIELKVELLSQLKEVEELLHSKKVKDIQDLHVLKKQVLNLRVS